MGERDRAYTRLQAATAKQKAVKVMKGWDYKSEDITPQRIGKMAGVHGKPCSCVLCGNPRRHFGELTVQERRHA